MTILLSAALALAGAVVAPQADCAGQSCVAGLSAKNLFDIAARAEAAGDPDQAQVILTALTRDPRPTYRAEARFRLGKLRERRGDRAGALAEYRRLLDEDPGAQRVRLEVARLLALTGDESGARRELRRASASGLPDDVARVVDQFATALRSRRTLGGTIEIALAPDSNINAATRRQTIETVIADLPLDDDARGRSGVGLALSGQGYWRTRLGGQALLTRLSGRADLYRDADFRDVSATLAVGPEYQWGRTRLRPAGIASRRYYGGRHYSDSYGTTMNLVAPAGKAGQIEAEVSMLGSRYAINPAQDGTIYDGNIAYDRAFGARLSTRLTARATRQSARDPGYATTAFGGDVLLVRQIGAQTLFGQVGAARIIGDARLSLFPQARRDTRWDATAGLLWRRWKIAGLSPVVRLTRTRNRSSLDIYDFRRTRAEFALSREF